MEEVRMRRVIGIDIHRTFGEVVIWEDGVLRHAGRVDMTRTALEGFGKSLQPTDEVVIEATGNCMAVSRVLSPFVARVIIANPLQVKAIAHSHVKTDKIDAGTLAQPACGRLFARDLDAGRGDRAHAPAGGAALSGRPSPHADQERGAFDPACPLDPALPACRPVQQASAASLAGAPAAAGRRARGDRPPPARTRPAGRGSCRFSIARSPRPRSTIRRSSG